MALMNSFVSFEIRQHLEDLHNSITDILQMKKICDVIKIFMNKISIQNVKQTSGF